MSNSNPIMKFILSFNIDPKKILVFLAIILTGSCYAATIKITADTKYYDKKSDVMIASGNVVVEGPDFRVICQSVIQYFKDDRIFVADNFEMEREGYRFSGKELRYSYFEKVGSAKNVRVNFGETFLGGGFMIISEDKLDISDGYFTGCNASSSHYHFSSPQVTLYTDTGLIVSFYDMLWTMISPALPLPTYIYSAPVPRSKFVRSSKQAGRKTEEIRTTQSFLEIGNNPADGNFLRQGFNWYFTPRSYAKLLLSYMEKNHFGAGITANYILNDRSEGEIRYGANEVENSYGGITHYISFGEKLVSKKEEKSLIYDMYKPGGKYSYELELKYSKRERINLDENIDPFSRVSFTGSATLRSNRKPLPILGKPFTYFMEASQGEVSEEVYKVESSSDESYTISSPRTNYFADITYDNDIYWLGKFKAVYDISLTDYGKVGSWDTSRQMLSLQQDIFDQLTIEYGHVHYLMERGFSPYLFENYYYSPYDQFVGSIKVKAWFSEFKIKTTYNLPSWDLYSVKNQWLLGMHCYNLIFEYDLRNDGEKFNSTFSFSFELTPSKWE